MLFAVVVLAVAAAVAASLVLKLPSLVAQRAVAATASAGFELNDVSVTGVRYADRDAVRAAAVEGRTGAILALDLDAVRARVEAMPWVEHATVARRLPDKLVISVTERQPAALWQYRGKLHLIDPTGHLLEPADLGAFARLPLVVGPGANSEWPSLKALLATQPQTAQQVDAATWISGRRWDLRMRSGETVMLPEGYGAAQAALKQFARLNGERPLLGQGYARLDFRLPGKMVVRLPVTDVPPRKAQGTEI
ncbi:MAG: FtsQ-type POTRA domain-containing protein [Sphingomonadaceae bacterium]|nr:FtsQ-type POTRA domain-containing protein [Sphingomonadaceae bacterium]